MDRYHFKRARGPQRREYWDPEYEYLCDVIDMQGKLNEIQRRKDLITRPITRKRAPRTTPPDRKRTRVRFT